MPLRCTVRTALLAFVLATPAFSQGLPGLWEPAEQGFVEVVNAYHFGEDGEFVEITTRAYSFSFVIENEAIVLVGALGGEQALDVHIEGRSMEMFLPDGTTVSKSKISGDREGAILLGDWTYPQPEGRAYERYTEDSRMILRQPTAVRRGTYAVEGRKIAVELEGVGRKDRSWKWTFERRGDRLSLKRRGESLSLQRIPGGCWYCAALDALAPQPSE